MVTGVIDVTSVKNMGIFRNSVIILLGRLARLPRGGRIRGRGIRGRGGRGTGIGIGIEIGIGIGTGTGTGIGTIETKGIIINPGDKEGIEMIITPEKDIDNTPMIDIEIAKEIMIGNKGKGKLYL